MSKSAIQIVRDLDIRIPDGFYANAAHTILYSHDVCDFTLPDRGGRPETALYLQTFSNSHPDRIIFGFHHISWMWGLALYT